MDKSKFVSASLCLACALASSCGGEDDATPRLPGEGSHFALAVSHFLADTRTANLLTIEDPAAQVDVDLSSSRELGGTTSVFGPEGAGFFVVGTSDGPTLTRYEVAADGSISEGDRLSLLNEGISSAFRREGLVPVLDEEKAYFLDDQSQQAIVWSPKLMEVESTISLEGIAPKDAQLEFGERAVVRGNRLFIPTTYYRGDETFVATAAAIVIDTDKDELVEVIEDDRCGNIVHAVPGDDGEIYFASGTIGASYREVGHQQDFPEPCILRVNKGEQTFDPDFYINMVELAGGHTAGRLIHGVGDHYYISIFDQDALSEPLDEANIWAAWEAKAWKLHRFKMGSKDAPIAVEGIPLTNGGGLVHTTGGLSYVELRDSEAGTNTLLVPQKDGNFETGITVSGVPYGLLWVR
jgi:hypothetical protein